MSQESFEKMLTGGHPNSLGRTIEVVEIILKDKDKLEELYQCYFSNDEVVRLRVSNAIKRIAKENINWLVPYIDKFLDEISKINQASTQWTLSQLFLMLEKFLSPDQRQKASEIMKKNLTKSNDWIVINMTIETLFKWSKNDEDLKKWLRPVLEKFSKDERKSISKKSNKYLNLINK